MRSKKMLVAFIATLALTIGGGSALPAASHAQPSNCTFAAAGKGWVTLEPGQRLRTRHSEGRTNWYCRKNGALCVYDYDMGGNRRYQRCWGYE